MADNNDILKAIESLRSNVATKSDLEAIKKDMATKQDIRRVEQGQAQTNTSLAQINTVLKALEAGQGDIREKMATKADVQDVRSDLGKYQKKNEQRFENLEEETGASNPHKN